MKIYQFNYDFLIISEKYSNLVKSSNTAIPIQFSKIILTINQNKASVNLRMINETFSSNNFFINNVHAVFPGGVKTNILFMLHTVEYAT